MTSELSRLFDQLSLEFRHGMILNEYRISYMPDNYRDLFDDYMAYCAMSI